MTNDSRLGNLSPEKISLLNRMVRERRGVADRIVRRREGLNRVPASFGQARIWFLDRLNPGSPVYQISTALQEHGTIDAGLLRQSINVVIGRHESLRTTFTEENGVVYQVIAPRLEVEVQYVDLAGSDDARERTLAFGSVEAARPFDLEIGPLLRLSVIRIDAGTSVVLLTMHHIVTDGWSMRVLLQELSSIYSALCTGKMPQLPALPIQYADYALWQRERLTPPVLEPLLAFWRQQLKGVARLQLPSDSPGPKRSSRGARELFCLGWSRTRSIDAIAAQVAATPFMVLLAAFQVLLWRYSGQVDIVVGTPVAGRTRPETENLIGFLLNTVCIRTSFSENPTFYQLLDEVRRTAVRAFAHQDVPFERVVEELAPYRRQSESALFNVMFVLQPRDGLRVLRTAPPGQSASKWQFENGTAKFDLTLSMAETEEGLVGALEYSTDLFEASTAQRMCNHFVTLIDSVAAGLHTPVSDLGILTGTELQTILHKWNETEKPFEDKARLEHLILDKAKNIPDAPAILCEGGEISYRELRRASLQVARHLTRRGVHLGQRVGIFLERGRHLLPAILGTWAAGCAYVPMDVESPLDRIRFVLDDAGLSCVLTETHLVDRLPLKESLGLCLDREMELIPFEPDEIPESGGSCADPAYMIYTSGSTGKPKGVLVSHRSVINYLNWVNETLLSDSSRLIPAISEITFDASLKQLFAPLLRGDPVWLVAAGVPGDLQALVQILSTQGDYTLNCVPWLWSRLLDLLEQGDSAARGKLKRLLVGGEQLSADLLERTFRAFPALEMWNLYGPTEGTANATACRLQAGQPVSIGSPVSNCIVRVLDSHRQLVPVGVPGELYIGGAGVAIGYRNRPELMEEAFIQDPFSAVGTSRLYKTGDSAFYRDDGSLVYRGRVDRQIKLHGFRIEPGEVETALCEHAMIRDAVVIEATLHGEQQLIAYLESSDGASVSLPELRTHIAQSLPRYMVPTQLIVVPKLPRGAHGKIDIHNLPDITDGNRPRADTEVLPRNDEEKEIAAIWKTVLGIDNVGIRSNFFSLGGHSLLAMQVVSRLRQKFAVDLPLRTIFERPTVEELSEILREQKASAEDPRLSAIPRLTRSIRG
jgi:amino acid adenylation domain-containing protein